MISRIVNELFSLLWWILLARIFMSWIPTINWNNQPFLFLRKFTDLFLEPFRRLIPPISGLDFSPIIALIFIQLVQVAIVRGLMNFGL